MQRGRPSSLLPPTRPTASASALFPPAYCSSSSSISAVAPARASAVLVVSHLRALILSTGLKATIRGWQTLSLGYATRFGRIKYSLKSPLILQFIGYLASAISRRPTVGHATQEQRWHTTICHVQWLRSIFFFISERAWSPVNTCASAGLQEPQRNARAYSSLQ